MEERKWEFDHLYIWQNKCNCSEVRNKCLVTVGDKLQTSVLFLLLQKFTYRVAVGQLFLVTTVDIFCMKAWIRTDKSCILLLGHHSLTFSGYHATQKPNQFTDRVSPVLGAHLGLLLCACLGEHVHLVSLRLFFFQNFCWVLTSSNHLHLCSPTASPLFACKRGRNSTWCEGERQGHGLGVGDGQQVLLGCEDRQLLEALAGSPNGEVVASVVSLQTVTEEGEMQGFIWAGREPCCVLWIHYLLWY